MTKYHFLLLCSLGLITTGCALTPGLQTKNLPDEGLYQTELGTQVNLIKLTKDTLPQSSHIIVKNDYAELFNTKQKFYTLSPGDVLSIYLWAHPEITPPVNNITNDLSIQANGYQIDQNGYIQFPMIGRYKVAGKTLAQVNTELRSKLANYLKTPDVVVRVISYQSQRYSVQGNVTRGGQFFLSDRPTSIYTALGLAGGVNQQYGDNSSIMLSRNGKTYHLNNVELEKAGYSLNNLLVQAGDTIYVNSRENRKVYLMGEAGKNQALVMRDQGMNLSDVLGEGLGINQLSADRSKIYVIRTPQNGVTQLYHLDLSNVGDLSLANQFAMQTNDIVYIDPTGLAQWQRVISQVLPFSNFVMGAAN